MTAARFSFYSMFVRVVVVLISGIFPERAVFIPLTPQSTKGLRTFFGIRTTISLIHGVLRRSWSFLKLFLKVQRIFRWSLELRHGQCCVTKLTARFGCLQLWNTIDIDMAWTDR